MSLKEQLAAEKEYALTYDNITKRVEDILVKAAKDGRSSVVIYLDDEDDYKTQVVCDFLSQEGIDFKKAYEPHTQRLNYLTLTRIWAVMRVSTLINQSL